MVARNYSSTAAETQLAEACTGSATVLRVASIVGFPPVPFTLIVDADTVYEEIVTVTAIAGTNLTVVRGEDGTTGLPHEVGARVRHGYTARDARDAANHIEATSGVHGVGATSSVVGTNTTQTLKNKTLDASNSINTGALPTEVSVSRLRLTSTTDASETSTGHAFQVGDTSGLNIIIDNNEVIGRNAGAFVPINMPSGIAALPAPGTGSHATNRDYVDGKDAARKAYVDDLAKPVITSGDIGTYADGWNNDAPGTSHIVRDGKRRMAYMSLRRQGSTIVVSDSGHIPDNVVRTLAVGDRPAFPAFATGSYQNGGDYGCFLTVNPNGQIVLYAAGSGVDIPYTEPGDWTLRFSASWYVA